MIAWRIHHKAETVSTNVDARVGSHGDVFTADYQTAGRGRLDHKWLSPPKTNLMMSVVLSVADLLPEHVATLPLVVGLAVVKTVGSDVLGRPQPPENENFVLCRLRTARRSGPTVKLKWPNDVLIDGLKVAGILCERNGDNVIAGIGVNVGQTEFDKEIADRATSLVPHVLQVPPVLEVRDTLLSELDKWYGIWRSAGFAAVYPEIVTVDFLKGREIAVRQTDDDSAPIVGISNGIMPDGSLDVGGTRAYAGEAHVEKI